VFFFFFNTAASLLFPFGKKDKIIDKSTVIPSKQSEENYFERPK